MHWRNVRIQPLSQSSEEESPVGNRSTAKSGTGTLSYPFEANEQWNRASGREKHVPWKRHGWVGRRSVLLVFPSPPLEACNANRVRSHRLSVRLLYTEKKMEGGKTGSGLPLGRGGLEDNSPSSTEEAGRCRRKPRRVPRSNLVSAAGRVFSKP